MMTMRPISTRDSLLHTFQRGWLMRSAAPLVLGGARLRASRTQATELAEQAEPRLGAGDQRDDHDKEANEDQHELPEGVAVLAEDAALIHPVAVRLRRGAVADGAPSDRQADRRCGRQLRLEIFQARLAVLADRALAAVRRHGADGRAHRTLGV